MSVTVTAGWLAAGTAAEAGIAPAVRAVAPPVRNFLRVMIYSFGFQPLRARRM
jgi:hypothetical protein